MDTRNDRLPGRRLHYPEDHNLGPLAAILFVVLTMAGAVALCWIDPAEANLPPCRFHTMTGFDCLGCGATRAMHALLHGRLLAALRYNAWWVGMLPLAAYLGVSELRLLRGHRPLPGNLARRRWFWFTIAAMAMAFLLVRNLP